MFHGWEGVNLPKPFIKYGLGVGTIFFGLEHFQNYLVEEIH